jgi:1,2-dihydroxy-3-keto-5-methylthiopentene dioxygenase
MAILRMEDGSVHTDIDAIQGELTPCGVRLSHWPTGTQPRLVALLGQVSLSLDEKEEVLTGLDHYFQQLQQEQGYQTRDLIVLHADLPGLAGALQKFAPTHFHTDDEVRFIVDGEGVFGFVRPDGSQVALTVQAGEFINVPANAEHWFVLTEAMRIKAVRYFTDTSGWAPNYTQTETRV